MEKVLKAEEPVWVLSSERGWEPAAFVSISVGKEKLQDRKERFQPQSPLALAASFP